MSSNPFFTLDGPEAARRESIYGQQLRANLDAGERAVAEVKSYVQYASNNLRGDRIASILEEGGEWHQTEKGMQENKSRTLQDPTSWSRVRAPVSAKVAFFEQTTGPAQPPPSLGAHPKDVFRVPTALDASLGKVRDKFDSSGNPIKPG